MKLTGALVAVAAVLALTACEKYEKRAIDTGTTVDQTSGSMGMAAPTDGANSNAQPAPVQQPSSMDTSMTETSSSSATSSAQNTADKNLAAANAVKNDSESKAYEPQSKSPDKTGSTSITGQDRSHAQSMQRKGTFVDPTVEGMTDKTQAAAETQSVQNLNLAQYPYNKRSQFKSAMDDRLGLIEERLGQVRSDDNNKAMVSTIEDKHDAAEKKLNEADKVDQARWEGYKIEFRDQVADLERSVNSLSSVRR